MYRFDLQEQFLPDYEMANWYVSTYPKSHFVTELIVARPDVSCRYTLRNNQFKVHHLNGKTESKVAATPSELRSILENEFQLNLSNIREIDKALERLTAS